MTGPAIGERYARKRGRRDLPAVVVVRQVHRPDRLVEVRTEAGEKVPAMTFRALRRDYRPA